MTTIRKLISAWMLTLVGSLLIPQVSLAATISGSVSYQGSPVTNVQIQLFERVECIDPPGFPYDVQHLLVDDIPIEPDGTFFIDVPPGSNYVVHVAPHFSTGLLRVYYPGGFDTSEAELIVAVDGSPATGIDFELQPGVIVSGEVTANAVGMANVRVDLSNDLFYEMATTDSNGIYQCLLLPGTDYGARATPASSSGWLGGYYPGASSYADATSFSVLMDDPVQHIDFQLTRAARISGSVLFNDNVVSSATVSVYQDLGSDLSYVAGEGVQSNGEYIVWVPSGSNYLVHVRPPTNSGFLPEYYNDAQKQEEAEQLSVSVEEPLNDIDFHLDQGGWISGTVTTGEEPEEYAKVEVFERIYNTNEWVWVYNPIHSTYTDLLGEYSVCVPPGTNYLLRATAEKDLLWGRHVWVNAGQKPTLYYGTADSPDAAVVVSTSTGIPAEHIDFDLGYLPSIQGLVLFEGEPVGDAELTVWQEVPFDLPEGMTAYSYGVSTMGVTDAQGRFRIRAATGSNFLIQVSGPPGSDLLPEYYNDVRSIHEADRFSFELGDVLTNLLCRLSKGFFVEGSVRSETGAAARFPYVEVFDDNHQLINEVTGGVDGTYRISAPVDEPCFLTASGSGLMGEYYKDSYSFSNAIALQGVTGDVVTADFVLFDFDSDQDGDGLLDCEEDSVPDGVYRPGEDLSDLTHADTDRDGVDDWRESISKTSPSDASDYLAVSEVKQSSAGLTFRWKSQAGVAYGLERSTNLFLSRWDLVGETHLGDGSIMQLEIQPTNGVGVYYRVCVPP